MSAPPRTLYDKLWDAHTVIPESEAAPAVLYIDLHLIHEVTTPQAFTELQARGIRPRRPDRTKATMDHSTPTLPAGADGRPAYGSAASETQLDTLARNCAEYGIELFGMGSAERGIVHVMAPELGLTQPGMTIVCGDSHTSTHGAFGALAFGIGSSEVGHVLATQCLLQRKSKSMAVNIEGELAPGVSAKDVILHVIGEIGVDGGTGHVIEYRGSTVRAMDMEQRMTLCNMSIEAGARAGMVAPDAVTFAWMADTPRAPGRADGDRAAFERAIQHWSRYCTDPGARFDREVHIDASRIRPSITWGTHPGTAIGIGTAIPAPGDDPAARKALDYMRFQPGRSLIGTRIDVVFIGSCTNGRLGDLRTVADVLRGRRIAPHVQLLVVPGSEQVKREAEAEGIDRIVLEAGGEWRTPGCSLCIAMNGDLVAPGKLAISTTNRNFEGRQGPGSRTLLASPLTAAWAAVHGEVGDPQDIEPRSLRAGDVPPPMRREVA